MLFRRGFILKPTKRASVFLKNGTRDFLNSPLFERSAYFYVTISGILNVFNTLILNQIFWKTKTFFQKSGVPFFKESTKTENSWFPDKTAISEANVKKNRIVNTKWTYHKERSFASNYFIFLKILFEFNPLFHNVAKWSNIL